MFKKGIKKNEFILLNSFLKIKVYSKKKKSYIFFLLLYKCCLNIKYVGIFTKIYKKL